MISQKQMKNLRFVSSGVSIKDSFESVKYVCKDACGFKVGEVVFWPSDNSYMFEHESRYVTLHPDELLEIYRFIYELNMNQKPTRIHYHCCGCRCTTQ